MSEWCRAVTYPKNVTKPPWSIQNICAIIFPEKGGIAMNLLKYAVKKERWDLAAHVIVLAALKTLNQGVKPDGRKTDTRKRRPKG
jgi:hypothetical protein